MLIKALKIVIAHLELQKARKELEACSDRELSDMGICRGQIMEVLKHHKA